MKFFETLCIDFQKITLSNLFSLYGTENPFVAFLVNYNGDFWASEFVDLTHRFTPVSLLRDTTEEGNVFRSIDGKSLVCQSDRKKEVILSCNFKYMGMITNFNQILESNFKQYALWNMAKIII